MARAKTATTQSAFAFAAPAPTDEAKSFEAKPPTALVEHEQLGRLEFFDSIAKATKIDALTNIWKLLCADITAAEFERRGYGFAIRRRASALLLKEQRKAGNGAAGITADASLERLIEVGELPPRPGQVIRPAAPAAKEDEPAAKPKRSRKKVANG